LMMAAASVSHNRINENISIKAGYYLKRKRCQSFSQDLRIFIPDNTLFTYPDLIVVCGEPKLYDEKKDIVLNPTIIVEVLSKSTASYNRGEKFALYRKIATLKEYVLIDSEKIWAEIWCVNIEGFWMLAQETENMSESLSLVSIDFHLPLTDVYNGTTLK
ncbi:MAG: Uma2 family endonuclease, partial [Cytophagales bacterium]